MSSEPKPRNLRWFQLGLRDILAMTLICAILLAWWHDRKALVAAAGEASEKEAEGHHAEVDRLREELILSNENISVAQRGCSLEPPVSGLVVSIPREGLVDAASPCGS